MARQEREGNSRRPRLDVDLALHSVSTGDGGKVSLMADRARAANAQANEYARQQVTPLYHGDETPTPSELGMLRRVALHFMAGYEAGRANALAQGRPQGWQPIETAPKDADVLLLYLDGSGVQPGYWDDNCWLACETQGLTGGRWHAEPTHWQPLPNPPGAEGRPPDAPPEDK